ncbi:glutamine synthetase family protein [Mesorhizobium sp. CA16]|uniref:glutamine synthetase family protein n=1 Tax=Mesorhizobium sp. CA16 TaxID=588496 RepID=UPI001CCC3E6E|nr:glutamine synthetase family protein [Mesorhizobium sp. CA16]MBZ9912895.1 glutamine synthetase family protein [Mesorhizobium sp. CA16]
MEFEDRVAAYAPKLEALQAELASRGVEFVEVHTVDTSGVVRSKIAPLKLSTAGESINAILYCVTHGDGQPMGDVAFASPSANEENGFPNIKGIIDPDTVVQHGWKPKFASAITRSYMLDGAVCPYDPRGVLARVEERARALGYEPKFALEYEFGIFHADHDLMRAGRCRELKPWGHSLINYDLVRSGEYQDFAAEFITRMKSIDIGVASLVTEYGYGMYEYALTPKSALAAADAAMRAKLHLRELCAERGLVATFMTRFQPPGKESACGAHHHVSLWRDGKPAFAAGPNRLTPVAEKFLAGVLNRMQETHIFFRPTVNSYRRFDRGAWSPEDVAWGFENRTAPIRAITTPNDAACRFEHRAPGADVNPYLSIAAILAAGCEGIEKDLPLEAPVTSNLANLDKPKLPRTLNASIEAFAASDFCAEAFGEAFRDNYAESRRAEQAAFDVWQASHITDFEWQRYFVS